MAVLDRDPTNHSNVVLIYSRRSEPFATHGVASGWNREHIWPKSFGVGYSGPDTSDLMALFPADWSVNSARSNIPFGDCAPSATLGACRSPPEAASVSFRSAMPSPVFMPPPAVRGDIARALFYMDVRYDGTESSTTNLTLTECSCGATSTIGNLATLLRWHEQDPPSDFERQRNGLVCAEYQGNRNPFIDHPEFAAPLFGGGAGGGSAACPVCPAAAAPALTESAPAVAAPNLTAGVSSAALAPGDVALVGFGSDAPDTLAFVFLGAGDGLPLAGGARLHFTDRGWDSGTGAFRGTSEGVLTYTAPPDGLAPGAVQVWRGAEPQAGASAAAGGGGSWASRGSFALSASGEQILVFADPDQAQGSSSPPGPRFLYGLSYSASAAPSWVATPPAGTAAALTAGTSTLPAGLAAAGAALELPHMDNYAYRGRAGGSRGELLAAVASAASWVGSNAAGALPHDYVGALAVDGGSGSGGGCCACKAEDDAEEGGGEGEGEGEAAGDGGCADSTGWVNGAGLSCAGYQAEGFCGNGAVAEAEAWSVGPSFRFPEHNCCVCGGGARAAAGRPAAAPAAVCADTGGWDNGAGLGCAMYVDEGFCAAGAVRPEHAWASGADWGWPERHCCECGKPGQ
jgi:endonuclease I